MLKLKACFTHFDNLNINFMYTPLADTPRVAIKQTSITLCFLLFLYFIFMQLWSERFMLHLQTAKQSVTHPYVARFCGEIQKIKDVRLCLRLYCLCFFFLTVFHILHSFYAFVIDLLGSPSHLCSPWWKQLPQHDLQFLIIIKFIHLLLYFLYMYDPET